MGECLPKKGVHHQNGPGVEGRIQRLIFAEEGGGPKPAKPRGGERASL